MTTTTEADAPAENDDADGLEDDVEDIDTTPPDAGGGIDVTRIVDDEDIIGLASVLALTGAAAAVLTGDTLVAITASVLFVGFTQLYTHE
jgi:hypothetical protein